MSAARCAVCGERLAPPQKVVCSLACRVARKKLTRNHEREYARRDYGREYAAKRARAEQWRAHWQRKADARQPHTTAPSDTQPQAAARLTRVAHIHAPTVAGDSRRYTGDVTPVERSA